MTIEEMPKIELHVHLDGSVRPTTLGELLHLPERDVFENSIAKETCEDLNDYLTKFDLPLQAMQTKENLTRIAYELVQDFKQDHVIYAEVRFAPIKHQEQGLSLEEVVESVLAGLQKGDIPCKLILCCMRNDTLATNQKIVDLATKYEDVVAVDLAGAEALYPTADFQELFAYAKALGVPFTIHAGEASFYESMKSAIDFGAQRLGHGVLSYHYPSLLEEIKEKNILLEICPTSNIQTRVAKDYKEHPFFFLFKEHVPVSINTDNRTVSNVTLSLEYHHLQDAFSLTIDDFYAINKEAIHHTFLSDIEKQKLEEVYQQYFQK